ncbi:hypothetical protein PHK61_21990 [Actinomycetospora lutea]|uniref:hypothetical protein n=1 Tax=Actinomycetospora lutea TaxID=663604 RepID=UPI002365D771|nr:hypothetical protein [Actinomycetospora lutea]MDD7941094.1 hypothetical protein [Actinomycetospora lutea]
MTDDDRRPDHADPPDPDDPAVAAALARTRADLAAHGAQTPAMPAGLLGDIDRALAAERAAPPAGDERPARSRRVLLGAAVAVVAAAAAVAALVASLTTPASPAPTPTAAPSGPPAPVLAGGDGVSALRAGLGRTDYGPLTDPGRLAGCLAAHGVPADARPAGARQVVVDGRPGVLLVLPTGVAARFRVLVVEPGCAAGAPLTVSDTLVGR